MDASERDVPRTTRPDDPVKQEDGEGARPTVEESRDIEKEADHQDGHDHEAHEDAEGEEEEGEDEDNDDDGEEEEEEEEEDEEDEEDDEEEEDGDRRRKKPRRNRFLDVEAEVDNDDEEFEDEEAEELLREDGFIADDGLDESREAQLKTAADNQRLDHMRRKEEEMSAEALAEELRQRHARS